MRRWLQNTNPACCELLFRQLSAVNQTTLRAEVSDSVEQALKQRPRHAVEKCLRAGQEGFLRQSKGYGQPLPPRKSRRPSLRRGSALKQCRPFVFCKMQKTPVHGVYARHQVRITGRFHFCSRLPLTSGLPVNCY